MLEGIVNANNQVLVEINGKTRLKTFKIKEKQADEIYEKINKSKVFLYQSNSSITLDTNFNRLSRNDYLQRMFANKDPLHPHNIKI